MEFKVSALKAKVRAYGGFYIKGCRKKRKRKLGKSETFANNAERYEILHSHFYKLEFQNFYSFKIFSIVSYS